MAAAAPSRSAVFGPEVCLLPLSIITPAPFSKGRRGKVRLQPCCRSALVCLGHGLALAAREPPCYFAACRGRPGTPYSEELSMKSFRVFFRAVTLTLCLGAVLVLAGQAGTDRRWPGSWSGLRPGCAEGPIASRARPKAWGSGAGPPNAGSRTRVRATCLSRRS